MPLAILLILVAGGISGLAVLLHILGKSKPVILTNDSARAAWLRLFPDEPVTDVTVANTGHAALIRTTNGPGLVWSFGVDTVARPLTDVKITETKKRLKIQFGDFTAPKAVVTLNETERADWRQKMAQT
ncbi:MAG: hypothetical protein JKY94_09610 [Rhodobacteraceae bacterium]|nr:hypothetical protein [Paracoccaceae bacterium]